MRIKLVFSYDGSKFAGFQRQKNIESVQKSIENVLSEIYHQPIEIKGAGRTDVGVHANNQVAHAVVAFKPPTLKKQMNNYLCPHIVIKKISQVSENFHARYSVKSKEYLYKINLGAYQNSLQDYYYQPQFKLDIPLMQETAKLFIGTHNFQNFVSGTRDNYLAHIESITFTKHFNKLIIHFKGKGFYRYMVRNLMGALIEVGKYKVDQTYVERMLNNLQDAKRLPTAPACGLYLNKIWYYNSNK